MLAASVFFFVAGARQYDGLGFLGLRQLRSGSSCAGLSDTCALNTKGILGVVRHPWYAGGVLIIAFPLSMVQGEMEAVRSVHFRIRQCPG